MTTPDDPMLRLRYLRETKQAEEAALYEQYLRETNQYREPDANQRRHDEFASGRLGRRIERENRNDVEEAAATPSLTDQIRGRVGGALSSVGDLIPANERMIAGIRAIGPETYEEALRDVRSAKEDSGPVANTLAASLPLVASFGATASTKLPAVLARGGALASRFAQLNPAKAAAVYGAAMGAGNSTPVTGPEGEGGAGRGKRMAIDAALSAGGAKALEYGSVALKSKLAQPVVENVKARFRQASEMAKPLYDKFRALGDLGDTPMLRDLVGGVDPVTGDPVEGLPVIRLVIKQVKGESPKLRKLADTDARVIDAVRKRLGKKAFQAQHGVETADAVHALDAAVADAVQGRSATLAEPVQTFAKGMQGGEAVARGAKVLKYASKPASLPTKNALKFGEAGFKEWAETAAPEQLALAREGIKGQIGASPLWGRSGQLKEMGSRFLPSVELREGARLLRESGEQIIPSTLGKYLNMRLGSPAPSVAPAAPSRLGAGSYPMPARTPVTAPPAIGATPPPAGLLTPPTLPTGPHGPAVPQGPVGGTPKMIPASTEPVAGVYPQAGKYAEVKGLLPSGSGEVVGRPHVTVPANPPPQGAGSLPAVPMPASQEQEALKRAIAATQVEAQPFDMQAFLRSRQGMEPISDMGATRRLIDALREIRKPFPFK